MLLILSMFHLLMTLDPILSRSSQILPRIKDSCADEPHESFHQGAQTGSTEIITEILDLQ